MILTQNSSIRIKNDILSKQVENSHVLNKPLYLLFIATKPCYIKLASVVHAFEQSNLPFLVIDVGQHYDAALISAQHEFDYSESIAVYLQAKGDLLKRNEILHPILREFYSELKENYKLKNLAIPVVSGDTSSAGIIPLIWYLLTGIKSIHIEGGLRSFAPSFKWTNNALNDLNKQMNCHWEIKNDQPFPEGLDTRLASICSQLFFAPIPFNKESLVREGYNENAIHLSGSLSADATELIQLNNNRKPIGDTFPQLNANQWLRVDIHRRENMTLERLKTLLNGLKLFQEKGGNILLVMTNALAAAIERFELKDSLDALQNEQLLITAHWEDYGQVIDFIISPNCLGIYTDSGGLQEESNLLGVKCATFRYSTDRPESIYEGRTNVLIPPITDQYIADGLFALFVSKEFNFEGKDKKSLYGKNVGKKIIQYLQDYTPEKPVIENIIAY